MVSEAILGSQLDHNWITKYSWVTEGHELFYRILRHYNAFTCNYLNYYNHNPALCALPKRVPRVRIAPGAPFEAYRLLIAIYSAASLLFWFVFGFLSHFNQYPIRLRNTHTSRFPVQPGVS